MPVEDMAADKEFARKYMFGLAMVLKKGLHIHIIHDVERPMKDMMLGLENWVPLYMTGQITPYYIKGVQNKVYSHLHYCSGASSARRATSQTRCAAKTGAVPSLVRKRVLRPKEFAK